MSGTQILMAIFNFYFFWNHLPEGDFTFPWGRGFIFKWGAPHGGGGGHKLWETLRRGKTLFQVFLHGSQIRIQEQFKNQT